MKYRGHTIEVDTDFDGVEWVYIYLPDHDDYGTDPIETSSVEQAKAIIDEMIADSREYNSPGSASWCETYGDNR